MSKTKVLVVDDSLTMRALISGALERIANVEVVGAADGAAEARQMVEQFTPHVMTLDVEMPGMSGLEYLQEVMESRPMPVIMFSTRTEAGAEASIEALRLGAIDCLPKPKVAVQAEFDAVMTKLGKTIKAARNAEMKLAASNKPATDEAPAAPPPAAELDWNGRIVAIGADAASTNALFDLFSAYPKNCPPTVVVQHIAGSLLEPLVKKLSEQVAPRVVIAEDQMPVEQGTIYFAPAGDAHVIVDSWPSGKLRFLQRDPVAGERPSISLLFASVARAAPNDAVGVLLSLDDEDGSAGLKALLAGGGYCLAKAPEGFALQRNLVSQPVPSAALVPSILKLVAK